MLTFTQRLLLAGVLLSAIPYLEAQTANGTITGLVSDPAGAVVSGAQVEARNVATGFAYNAITTETGNYTIVQVPVGPYEVNVNVAGFKRSSRQGLDLIAAQVMRIDMVLEVGSTTESVTVTAQASLLKTETGALVQNVSLSQLQNLPILPVNGGGLTASTNGFRDPYAVARLLPGVQYASASTMIVNGAPNGTFNFLIEGQTANQTNGAITSLAEPSADAVQEVAVMTSNFSAEFGAVGGGVFNITMKSGTNQYHGNLYDYSVNEIMNAAQPYSGLKTTQRRHDYGGTFGGPLSIPKLYSGKNKTFYFFGFEQYRENVNVRSESATVPLVPYRTGDFSQLITLSGNAAGPRFVQVASKNYVDPLGRSFFSGTLFDQNSTRSVVCPATGSNCTAGGNYSVRDAFLNNQVPVARFDSVAQNIMKLVPNPIGPNADKGQPSSNYQNPFKSHRTSELPSIKLDHSVGTKGHASFYWHSTRTETAFNYPNGGTLGLPVPIDPGRGSWSQANIYRVNYDHTLTPTLLLHFGLGYTAENFRAFPPEVNYNAVTSLGLRGATVNSMFPQILSTSNTTTGGLNALGSSTGSTGTTEHRPSFNASATWVRSSHTFKSGGEWALDQFPTSTIAGTNGTYGFGGGTVLPALIDQTTTQGSTGFAFADFLLGNATSVSLSVPASYRIQKYQAAWFVQDTWKATRKLTVDYGLRWDWGTYSREQYGRNANFDATIANASAGGHPGGSIFEATCNCNFAKNYPWAFGPRLGVAYQIDSKTVLRGGYGIVYNRTGVGAGSAVTSASGGNVILGQVLFQLKDGIPANVRPQWPVYDANIGHTANTVVGGPALLDSNSGRPARQAQWSFGLQREITRNLVIEASYVANRGVWWSASGLSTRNDVSQELLGRYGFSVGNLADAALLQKTLSALNTTERSTLSSRGVGLPYTGFPTTQNVRQSLKAFPQYSGSLASGSAPLGKTWYDSLQVVVTKRLSHGLSLNGTYTFGKTLDLMSSPDVFNRQLGKDLSGSDLPHAFQMSAEYTVPTLRNGVLGKPVVSQVLSNWGIGWYMAYQSGARLGRPASASANSIEKWLGRGPGNAQLKLDSNGKAMNPYAVNWTDYDGKVHAEPIDINCHCFDPQRTLVLNPLAWENIPDGQWANSFSGIRYYRGIRQPNENANVSRNFRLKERVNLQVRAEFQNVFNRMRQVQPTTSGFNANPTQANGVYTGGFGTINPVAGSGLAGQRSGVLIGRLTF